jgi:hypothetical protein
MPQVKSKQTSNKGKKDSTSSSNNNNAKSNVVASSSSIDSTNDSLSQVTLELSAEILADRAGASIDWRVNPVAGL